MRRTVVLGLCLLMASPLGVIAQAPSDSGQKPSRDSQSPPTAAAPPDSTGQSPSPPNQQPQGQPPESPPPYQQPNGEAKPAQVPDAPSQKKSQKELEAEKQEQSYRVMGIVPMFSTTSRHNPTPLTSKEKFHLFVRSAFDPVNFVIIGAQAGISQAQNSFDSYGQGAEGYAKRYGAAFADSVDSGFFSNFFYPVVFKQDPRYFRLGEGTVKHRIVYSLEQEFVAHKDSGGKQFHFSNVLGALTAGSISNAYYPDEDRGFGLTMSRAGIAILYGSLGGIFSEFWPDIQKKVLHKNKPGNELPTDVNAPATPIPPAPPK